MKVNYKELGDRLTLSCMTIQKSKISEVEFEKLLTNSLDKISSMFLKRYVDIESKQRIKSVIDVYKRKCITEFNNNRSCG